MKRTSSPCDTQIEIGNLPVDAWTSILSFLIYHDEPSWYKGSFQHAYVLKFVSVKLHHMVHQYTISQIKDHQTKMCLIDEGYLTLTHPFKMDFPILLHQFMEMIRTPPSTELVWWFCDLDVLSKDQPTQFEHEHFWESAGAMGDIRLLEWIHTMWQMWPDTVMYGAVHKGHAHVVDWILAAFGSQTSCPRCSWDYDDMVYWLIDAVKFGHVSVLKRLMSSCIAPLTSLSGSLPEHIITCTVITSIPGELGKYQLAAVWPLLDSAIQHNQIGVLEFLKSHGLRLSLFSYEFIRTMMDRIKPHDGDIKDPILVRWLCNEIEHFVRVEYLGKTQPIDTIFDDFVSDE